jgi:hypothetical protein
LREPHYGWDVIGCDAIGVMGGIQDEKRRRCFLYALRRAKPIRDMPVTARIHIEGVLLTVSPTVSRITDIGDTTHPLMKTMTHRARHALISRPTMLRRLSVFQTANDTQRTTRDALHSIRCEHVTDHR